MKRILIVDDEVAVFRALREFFEGEDFTVFTASTGEEALKIVEEKRPKILLIDIRMPGMNGKEVVKRARQIDRSSIIIVVTAVQDESLKEEIKGLGASDLVYKPINLRAILKLIEQNLASIE